MKRRLPGAILSLLLVPALLMAQGTHSDYSLGKKDHEIDSTLMRTDALEAPVTLSIVPARDASKAPASLAPSVSRGGLSSGGSAATRPVYSVGSITTIKGLSLRHDAGRPIGGERREAAPLDGKAAHGAEGKALGVESDRDAEVADVSEPAPRPGQLTAGEWNDLTEWSFWNSVIASSDWKHMTDHWGIGKGRRISVRVDNGRDPIPDAVATLIDGNGATLWTARTDNHGRAELFTGLDRSDGDAPYQVVVRSGGKETRLGGIDPDREQSPSESPLVVRVTGEAPALKTVDLMFMVDATGSMGDELNYIKAELQSVIDRVRAEMGEEFVIRLSTNVYRDKGDEYVVRSHRFTEEIDAAAEFLRNQTASGGGDTPEAVEEALEDAIRHHEWSESAQSRFLFFVLDAPPHYTENRLLKLRELTREAASKGIRIVGVSGSGVDKETEFLMRGLGMHTGGTYVFLTDHSGIGESHVEPTVGSYAVEYLDDLIVRLIVQYTKRPESVDAITARKPNLD